MLNADLNSLRRARSTKQGKQYYGNVCNFYDFRIYGGGICFQDQANVNEQIMLPPTYGNMDRTTAYALLQ